jgi:hypothetical protein
MIWTKPNKVRLLIMEWLEGEELQKKMAEWDKDSAEKQLFELEKQKKEAQNRGKELFDEAKLEKLIYHMPHQRKDLEYIYYVQQSSLMTIAEFADSINQTVWWDRG